MRLLALVLLGAFVALVSPILLIAILLGGWLVHRFAIGRRT